MASATRNTSPAAEPLAIDSDEHAGYGRQPTTDGDNMSHTAVVEFPCNEGKGAELLATLKVALVDTRAFAGNEGIETYSDQDDPDLVVLWEKWATRADYEAYLAWRMETGLMDVLAPFMDTSKLRIVHLQAHQDV